MFEKSLYDLIRGLRNHKGNESEYIQSILKECRAEVRSQDMDVKATALLKLIYLDMFGHEMSWASFHVLEVMSSTKHLQKRVGFLGAAQTFRPDTEVLMLATNLLKKDLASASIPTMSLTLITVPHLVTSSLALSLLPDILPRLTHSLPAVRKKTVVVLYRLALVYPETLRIAWPRIKDRLMAADEDSSVTAAVVNVVCEMGWRRPQDFLSLAPRLFELLIEEGNNWMLIKIIKLFATLTPFEPRLVKKLVPPLTNLIKSTEAMSLLYECINGIIQGGIINATEGGTEGDELAGLCLSKLRAMILLENDPNLKYVALLAFNKIVLSHPAMVSEQQDVIMGCLDDPDISIRLQALELVSGMVNMENLEKIVDRLMKQLSSSSLKAAQPENGIVVSKLIEPMADSDEEDPAEILVEDRGTAAMSPIPNDYRRETISRILTMCGQDTYANIPDFEWYLDTLVQLVRLLPPTSTTYHEPGDPPGGHTPIQTLAQRVGSQLRDIAVRVRVMRSEACHAAERLVKVSNRVTLFPEIGTGADPVLESIAWTVGEFAQFLASPWDTLDSLIHTSSLGLSPSIICAYLQAIPKVFLQVIALDRDGWNLSRKTNTSLLLNRMIAFVEDLSTHPNLEVQERAVEFLELFRLAAEALSSLTSEHQPPGLLTSAFPHLFAGHDLNPVAPGAQKKISTPANLDLGTPINPNLPRLLEASRTGLDDVADGEFEAFYYDRAPVATSMEYPSKPYEPEGEEALSYQIIEAPDLVSRRKAERRERNRDDPFYIPNPESVSERPSPFNALGRGNEAELDLDAIPIVDLRLEGIATDTSGQRAKSSKQPRSKAVRRIEIVADENFDSDLPSLASQSAPRSFEAGNAFPTEGKPSRPRNLLQVDSSGLQQLSLMDDRDGRQMDMERREADEAEMAAALKEVERMRLEMQRAAERVATAEGVDLDGTVVKRKKKRKPRQARTVEGFEGDDDVVVQKGSIEEGEMVQRKKKKKMKKLPVGEASSAE